MLIKVESIKVNKRMRDISEDKVTEIASSIKEIGLLNPITISENSILIAGLHRLNAFKMLGYAEIEANVVKLSDLDRELAEIDENLIRADLHFIDRGDHLKRRKEIYELKYPETKQGTAQRIGQIKNDPLSKLVAADSATTSLGSSVKTFVEDTSDKAGISKRVIHEEIQISSNLTPEIKEQVKKADLSKTEALKLARLEPEKQKEVIERVIEKKEKAEETMKAIDMAGSGMSTHSRKVLFSSEHDNWGTPKELYDELNKEFGFDFDPCPLDSTFDGLLTTWKGSIFINPPYSNITGFLLKGHEELKKNNAHTIVYLIPVRTDTQWFHNYVYPYFKKEIKPYAEIRFIKGRVKFSNGLDINNSAPFPSMLVIFKA